MVDRAGIYIDKLFQIYQRQYDYQPMKSTETALDLLTLRIEKAIEQKGLGRFIDIDDASWSLPIKGYSGYYT